MDLGFGSIMDGIGSVFGGGSGVVPTKDTNQMGGGLFSSDLIGAMIIGGTGLIGSFLDQSTKRKALEQSNKQAEDEYRLKMEALNRGGGSAAAALELQKKQLMLEAYNNYANSYFKAAQIAQTGFGKVATDMQTAALMRAR
jgi:hypothetical protein